MSVELHLCMFKALTVLLPQGLCLCLLGVRQGVGTTWEEGTGRRSVW